MRSTVSTVKLGEGFAFPDSEACSGFNFGGPVIAAESGIYLVPKSKMAGRKGGGVAGVAGQVARSMGSLTYPFPKITCQELREIMPDARSLSKLKDDQEVIAVEKGRISGFRK